MSKKVKLEPVAGKNGLYIVKGLTPSSEPIRYADIVKILSEPIARKQNTKSKRRNSKSRSAK